MVLHSASNTEFKALRQQTILELELDSKLHARAAIADGGESPVAAHVPERSLDELHEDLRVLLHGVARREFHAQQAARDLDGGEKLAVGQHLDAGADAPRQELRIARPHH